jgi:L-asparaginase
MRIGLLATGGTIVYARDGQPSLPIERLISQAGLPADLAFAHTEEHLRVDSCDITPDQMLGIARRARDVVTERQLDGLVVTHGSDALEETSFLCDLLVESDPPLVFTAAMRPSNDPAGDGARNLAAAARLARSREARGLGALVLAAEDIHAARWVRKQDSFRLSAFQSAGHGPLGAVTPSGIQLWQTLPHRVLLPFPEALSASVPALQSFSGMTADYVSAVARASAADGIVIEGSGLGNIPAAALPAIRELVRAGVVVAVTSRALTGGVHAVYQQNGGAGALQDAGAVLAGSLPTNKARLLSLLALALSENRGDARELLDSAIQALDRDITPPRPPAARRPTPRQPNRS